jgi:Tetratricopeptide repeat
MSTRAARDLNQDTFARQRRTLGEDDPSTLRCASNLAADLRMLGEAHAARDLDQDTLDRRRRVLGEDHPTPSALRIASPPPCANWARQRPAARCLPSLLVDRCTDNLVRWLVCQRD